MHSAAPGFISDLVDVIDIGFSVQDATGRVVYVNEAGALLTGYPSAEAFMTATARDWETKFELLDESGRVISPDSLPGRRALRGEHPEPTLIRFRVKATGEERWAMVTATPRTDEAGRVQHVVSVYRDVSAQVAARSREEAHHAVTRVLAQSVTLQQAAPNVLRAICDGLGWEVGGLWTLSPTGSELTHLAGFVRDGSAAHPFVAESRLRTFGRGEGLPGDVWDRREPVWINDFASDSRFPRAALAAESELGTAVASPILLHDEFIGVLEFFNRGVRDRDDALLQMLDSIGSQLGLFVERVRSQEMRARLGAIVQHSNSPIIGKSLDGVVTSWNEAAERLYGYTAEEMIGKHISVIAPPERPDEIPGILARIARGETVESYETVRIARDGRRIEVSLTISPIRSADGVIVGASKITEDISERKQSERALRFLDAASRELSSSLDYEVTLAAVARLAVPAVCDWCAIDILDEKGGLHRLAVEHSDPAKLALARELAAKYPPEQNPPRALETGRSELHADISEALIDATAPDDDYRDIIRGLGLRSAMTVPLIVRGRTLGVISFIAAESGRRYGPADLRFAEDLAERAALAVENARLFRQIQDSLTSRDEFLASVSHDLRNPLAAIKAGAELLLLQARRTGSIPPERLDSMLNTIASTAQRMARVIDGLLDISRMQMGQPLDLQRSENDLAALAQAAVREREHTSDRHRLVVKSASEVVGQWDGVRLQRVLSNLIDNAVKYSPDGGEVTVTVEREDDQTALLVVTDHGIGVPEADLPTIFERFRRGGNAERIPGTGIGLAGARQIVEQHGGTIRMESQVGDGTSVFVRLPLAVPEAAVSR